MPLPSHKKVLLGDNEGNQSELLEEIIKEVGGKSALAGHIAKHLKDSSSNPYLQTRAAQAVMRLMDKVDSQKRGEAVVLTDDELDEEIVKGCVRLLVTMPAEAFDQLMTDVQGRRNAFAAREAKARLAKENAGRPIGAVPGVERA